MITIYFLKGTEQGCSIYYSEEYSPCLVETIHLNVSSTKALQMYAARYHHTIEDSQRMIRKRYKFNQKIPVFVEKDRSLFFPTASKTQWECCWINYYAVEKVKKCGKHSKVRFHELGKKYCFSVKNIMTLAIQESEFEMLFNLDVRILRKQMQRCHQIVQDLQKEEMNDQPWQN